MFGKSKLRRRPMRYVQCVRCVRCVQCRGAFRVGRSRPRDGSAHNNLGKVVNALPGTPYLDSVIPGRTRAVLHFPTSFPMCHPNTIPPFAPWPISAASRHGGQAVGKRYLWRWGATTAFTYSNNRPVQCSTSAARERLLFPGDGLTEADLTCLLAHSCWPAPASSVVPRGGVTGECGSVRDKGILGS